MIRNRMRGAAALLAASLCAGLDAQTPAPPRSTDAPPATGLVVGQVIDALTNRPIANAVVGAVSGAAVGRELVAVGIPKPPPARRILTDAQGRFMFAGLAAGIYTFNTTASGYMDGAYGQRRPSGPAQPFVLADDQRIANVTIRLWKEAALGGAVLDEAGEPAVGVQVAIFRRELAAGRMRTNMTNTMRSDDRGMYRFSRLLPGDYFVVVPNTITSVSAATAEAFRGVSGETRAQLASTRGPNPTAAGIQAGDAILQVNMVTATSVPPRIGANGQVIAYPTTFYPNAGVSARASVVALAAGEERSGLDIQLRPSTMVRVSGTLMGPAGPAANFGVRLTAAEEGFGDGLFNAASTLTDASGRFDLIAVPPGEYVLRATRISQPAMMNGRLTPQSSEAALYAELPVSVGESPVSGLTLQLRDAESISGRIVFDGGAPPPALQGLIVSFVLIDRPPLVLSNSQSRVSATGEFTVGGLVPGQYYVMFPNVPGRFIASATLAGRDVLHHALTLATDSITDLVLTYTDRPSTLGGAVLDAQGKTDLSASVVLFPVDFPTWPANMFVNTRIAPLVRSAPQTGVYKFISLIPGEYFVAALSDDALVTWPDPRLMQSISAFAQRVTIGAGEQKQQDLKTGLIR